MKNEKIMISDSKERVAYDLMLQISDKEKDEKKDRAYWLTLYNQCYNAAIGNKPTSLT